MHWASLHLLSLTVHYLSRGPEITGEPTTPRRQQDKRSSCSQRRIEHRGRQASSKGAAFHLPRRELRPRYLNRGRASCLYSQLGGQCESTTLSCKIQARRIATRFNALDLSARA